MSTLQLRVFPYEDVTEDVVDETEATVSVRLSDFLPILDRAFQERRVWLRDFRNDEVRVSSDLYDILRAVAKP